MSHIGRIPRRLPARQSSAWRYFPWWLAAAMAAVFAVNAGMVWSAVATFPGAAISDSFDESNEYNQVLDAVDRQNALGWSIAAESDGRKPLLNVTDRQGRGLDDALIDATAVRPLGPPERTHVGFRRAASGRYVSDTELTQLGQWDLMLRVAHAGHQIRVTRRIVLR